MSNKQRSLVASMIFTLFLSVPIVEGFHNYRNFNLDETVPHIKHVSNEKEIYYVQNNTFQSPDVNGLHAIVYDIKNDTILFEKDAYVIYPMASLTKVAAALVSDEILSQNYGITINSEALSQNSDNGLLLNEKWSFKKLLDFSLLVSSNDGAYAIASIAGALHSKSDVGNDGNEPVADFVDLMNQRVREMGLRNIHFNNPSGLDVNEVVSGGYGTAYEIAKLFEYATENNYNVLEVTQLQSTDLYSESNIVHEVKNTNTALSDIPALISSKTGYTTLAGGNLAIVFDVGVNHPIAVVVLGSTYDSRFNDVSSLVSATLEYFSR